MLTGAAELTIYNIIQKGLQQNHDGYMESGAQENLDRSKKSGAKKNYD